MDICTKGTVVFLALTLASACAQSNPGGEVTPRQDHSIITHGQLADNHFNTAYEAVSSLRSNWLQTRGTDSFRTPSRVWVYFDSIKLGGIETLSSIAIMTVSYIQHFDGIDATTRWGVGHSAGVIYVSTHPVEGPRARR